MPQITLDIVSMDAVAVAVARSCHFDGNGGTIGRDETNALVLPDKHRRVSRLHAAVTFPAGIPTLTNASTSLSISIGDVPLDCGQTIALSLGDLLEIGPYILKVRSIGLADIDLPVSLAAPGIQSTAPAQPAVTELIVSPVERRPAAPAFRQADQQRPPQFSMPPPTHTTSAFTPVAVDDNPFASLLAGIGSAAPRSSDEFLSGPAPAETRQNGPQANYQSAAAGSAELAGVSVDPLAALGFAADPGLRPQGAPSQRVERPAAALIPEDFNPFDLPSGAVRNSADPFSSLLGGNAASTAVGGGEPSIDSLFAASDSSLFGASLPASASARLPQSVLDDFLASPANSDPLALFGASSSPQGPSLRPVRDDLAEVSAAYQPPRALQPESPMARPAHHFASQAVAQPATDSGPAYPADLLTQAFLNGAKLPMNLLPNGLTPELMAIVGSLLRSATTGAVDMLAARTATKLEVQANVTVISAQANNPLKFLPSGEVALQQLLSKRMPGFMPPDEAMKDAFDDLRAHEIGVIAGTRAALAEVLGRFDPNLLGQRLAAGSLLDSLLPSVRKTKLWDIYVDRYAQIRGEAEDDFQSIFGRAFVQAYERETARMKSQQSAPGAQT